jgi:RNA polymerase sigma-70 factor (ECF subfamily)
LDGYVRRYLRRRFDDDSVVDDLCQETHVRLLRCIPAVREPTSLAGFVAKVALHVTQDHLRAKYRRREEDLEAVEPTASVAAGAEPVLERLDLERALGQLPERSRQIMLLMADGYRYEEIAATVGITVSGVKMQVKRSLDQMRAALAM